MRNVTGVGANLCFFIHFESWIFKGSDGILQVKGGFHSSVDVHKKVVCKKKRSENVRFLRG